MLHTINHHKVRDALLKTVEMQRRLVVALCEPATSASEVCPRWLDAVWNGIDPGIGPDFATGFYGNKIGPRSSAMRVMANATHADKQHMKRVLESQLEFTRLFGSNPAHQLIPLDDSREPFASMRCLMEAFYDEWLQAKSNRGYPFAAAELRLADIVRAFHPLVVCPYCDGTMRTVQIDHVLPKSQYPCLSCHPDNLAPACGGCNSVQIKGNKIPLTPNDAEIAKEWFHPHLRSGHKIVQAKPEWRTDRTLSLTLTASTPENHQRAQKLDKLLKITAFWGADLDGDIRSLPMRAKIIRGCDEVNPVEVRKYCEQQALLDAHFRGSDHLAIYHEGLHQFVAGDDELLADIVIQYEEDERARQENAGLLVL